MAFPRGSFFLVHFRIWDILFPTRPRKYLTILSTTCTTASLIVLQLILSSKFQFAVNNHTHLPIHQGGVRNSYIASAPVRKFPIMDYVSFSCYKPRNTDPCNPGCCTAASLARRDMLASNKNIFASTLWLTDLNADSCAESNSEIRFS